jgi:predicted DNA-binding protein (UPF0251 family)
MILQPHLGSLNAGNWLADMRRSEPRYAKRVFTPPKWVKHCGKIRYPASEIERVIKELNMAIDGAGDILERLKPQFRNALTLTKVYGYSLSEAAERTGISESAMKSRVSRAVKAAEALLHQERDRR